MSKGNDTGIRIKRDTLERFNELQPFESMNQDETLNLFLDVYEQERKRRFFGFRNTPFTPHSDTYSQISQSVSENSETNQQTESGGSN